MFPPLLGADDGGDCNLRRDHRSPPPRPCGRCSPQEGEKQNRRSRRGVEERGHGPEAARLPAVSKYFTGRPGQRRARRAVDAVAVGTGLLLLVWAGFNSAEVSTSDQWFLNILEPLPGWIEDVWKIGYIFGLFMVIALFVAAIGQRRGDLLRDMTLALVVSVGLAILLAWWVSDTFPMVLPELTRPADPEASFPILRVAAIMSVTMVAVPHLTRPVRLFGWAIVLIVAISGLGLGLGLPSDAVGAIGLGLVSGGTILLIFGSLRGYPDVDAIAAALSDLGVSVSDLTLVPDQSWGVRTLSGSLPDGSAVQVLAYGRDAADTRMAAKTWRSLWYRDTDRTVSFSRLEAVEHEALAMLMAGKSGVSTQTPLAVGVAGDDMAVLAMTADGAAFSDPTTEQLVDLWEEVARLHRAGIAHGSLTFGAVSVGDDGPILGDLAHASFNATESQLSTDIVSLLFESAVAVGAEDAVAAARQGISDDELVGALAYLQVPALTPVQRRVVDKPKVIVNDLRDAVAEATGAELPEPAKLRRVRPKDLIMPALSLIAAYALIGLLADIDFAAVWAVVRDASWVLIITGFFIGQIAFFFDATGMLFATGYPLPMKPLVVLQLAVKWIGLAIPSAAGRVAMNTIFLRKYGVPPTIAITQGAIDGLSGFVVEAAILLVAFVVADIPVDVDTGEVAWGLILGIVALIILGTVIAILRIRRLRDLVIPILKESWGSLAGVLTSPNRSFGLLGSNLASRLILAATLWFILEAVGSPLSLVTALVITAATNLLAGLVPIPGGIGVAEAALTSFLVFAGLDPDTAFAVAVVFRVTTFYIPAGQGLFAMRWLEAGDYV